MHTNEQAYSRKRALQEAKAAATAACEAARQRHLEMADLYRRRLGDIGAPAGKTNEPLTRQLVDLVPADG